MTIGIVDDTQRTAARVVGAAYVVALIPAVFGASGGVGTAVQIAKSYGAEVGLSRHDRAGLLRPAEGELDGPLIPTPPTVIG